MQNKQFMKGKYKASSLERNFKGLIFLKRVYSMRRIFAVEREVRNSTGSQKIGQISQSV